MMAHFYADIQGRRGEATRCGDKGSGITGHIRGWTIGARVDMSHDDGVDHVRVFRTGGSGSGYQELIAEFDTNGNLTLGKDDPVQRLRDAMTAAIEAGIDIWPILADEVFKVREGAN